MEDVLLPIVSGFRVPFLLMTPFINDSPRSFFSSPLSLFPSPQCPSPLTFNPSSTALATTTMIIFTPHIRSPPKTVLVPSSLDSSVPSLYLSSPIPLPSTSLTGTEFLSRRPLTGVGSPRGLLLFRGFVTLSILTGCTFLVWKM